MHKYNRIRRIGKGNFGDVWLIEDQNGNVLIHVDSKKLAMKRVDLLFSVIDPQVEVELMSVLHHPNIIKYFESFRHKDKLCIVMEYAQNCKYKFQIQKADLSVYLQKNPPKPLTWLTQICHAVKYLHEQKVIHRDIKLSNVFLMEDGVIKLGDFSISKKVSELTTKTSLGTPFYLSPEICQGQQYNHKTDIWNLGCLLYEMLTLQKPFQGDSMASILHSILNKESPKLVNHTTFQQIIDLCLQKDPEKRPEVAELLKLPQLQKESLRLTVKYRLANIDCPQFEVQKNSYVQKNQFQQQLTPQYKQPYQSQLISILSECTSPNKKPYKKVMTINTQLIEETEQDQITQKKPQFAKFMLNPKTPTSPQRNMLLHEFLRNKLGSQKFDNIRDILQTSQDPIKLLDSREEMLKLIGEQNMDCVKIFKLLISNSITPPSSHFRAMSAYQFIDQRNKTASQVPTESQSDIKTKAWDEQF